MLPTAARCSKALRMSLTPKRGNKDYYKGTRQAYLPHSIRTGPPGRWTRSGAYRILDTKVRVYIAPPIAELNKSELKPYAPWDFGLTEEQKYEAFGRRIKGGLNAKGYLSYLREAQTDKAVEPMTGVFEEASV
ncbi:hypothetical protein K488DRAFT_84778 [Vararia minispora EC-137]|uniref:Uncharacterized protein n=1 Tax=Vararia minispora EC-137 TaxID=1314806 RepID=A0ACB8QNZ5_9AGAM|nr:hypothetical protein K488DRAFT_84778 [Vararia minispora EC-137]